MALYIAPLETILEKLAAGDLPRRGPAKLYAGYGRGYRCAACDRTITPSDVECEIEFSDGVTYRMHRECTVVWEAECERRAAIG